MSLRSLSILAQPDVFGRRRTDRTSGHPFSVSPDGRVLRSGTFARPLESHEQLVFPTNNAHVGSPQRSKQPSVEKKPRIDGPTSQATAKGSKHGVPLISGNLWPRRQRAGCSLHRVAFGRPIDVEAVRFFVERLTQPEDVVYDPYMGRGTVPIEALLLGRIPFGNDPDPLCEMIVQPLLTPQFVGSVMGRLHNWSEDTWRELPPKLLRLFHPGTLHDLIAIRDLLCQRANCADEVDQWIQAMVLVSFTDEKDGCLVGPTIHPNSPMLPTRRYRPASAPDCQLPRKEVFDIVRRITEALTRDWNPLVSRIVEPLAFQSKFSTGPAEDTPNVSDNSVDLVLTRPLPLTSPRQTTADRLRRWFAGLQQNPAAVRFDLDGWKKHMRKTFVELYRVVEPGGHLVIETGRLKPRKHDWSKIVLDCGRETGFEPICLVINSALTAEELWRMEKRNRKSLSDQAVVLQKPDEEATQWRTDPCIFAKPLPAKECR